MLLALTLCTVLCRPVTAITPAPGGDFTLTDQYGEPWSLQQARGKLVLLLFGYTSCPDVCPTGLLTVQQILQQLGDRAASVQPLFISVDPQRDTPEVLKAYVGYFHPTLIGLTGQPETLDDISRRYRTSYSYGAAAATSGYSVDHSSSLYVIDAQGQLTSIIPFGTPTDIILDSVQRLLPPQQ